jgi:anaerobic nitric oxide reductase transcription regulator
MKSTATHSGLLQAKLLRVLEEGEVERIGSEKRVSVEVRVVVAARRDLEVREEDFRLIGGSG